MRTHASWPWQLHLAQRACRHLPPIAAQRVRALLYPSDRAVAENLRVVVRSHTGSPFVAYTGDCHMYPFAVHGYFSWRNWAVAKAVCTPGDVIVEVGANVGTETIGFSDIVGPSGQVIALEPCSTNVDRLREAVHLNRSANISIREFAASDRDGPVNFASPETSWDSGLGHVTSAPGIDTPPETAVHAVRLDSLMSELRTVRALFSDTEGHEVAVLRGACALLERDRPVVILEAAPKHLRRSGESVQSLYEQLNTSGYVPFRMGRLRIDPVESFEANRASNWVCLHRNSLALASRIDSYIRRCGLFPMIPGLNPLSFRRHTQAP